MYRSIFNDKTVLQDEIHTNKHTQSYTRHQMNEWSGSNSNEQERISTRQNNRKKEADSIHLCIDRDKYITNVCVCVCGTAYTQTYTLQI